MLTEEQKAKSAVLAGTEPEAPKIPPYTAEEIQYLGGLQQRLWLARTQRDARQDEFDGMTYLEYYESNEKWANSFITPKKNREDTNFISGTVRAKLLALLAALNNLDLASEWAAFDEENVKIVALGDAMEDVILKTCELDNDDEKKLMRQYEMLKQGTVFVEELWDERYYTEKKMTSEFDGTNMDVKWTTRLKKAFARPTRNVIPGPNVYLGDITQYDMEKQPYIFTVAILPYSEAQTMFGDWERWQYVTRELRKFAPEQIMSMFNNTWRLTNVQKEQVEVVRYQDKWNNEFVVLCNGVLMTPVGLPLPWGYTDYNISKQNFEPFHSRFAYGNSFVRKIRNDVAILDEMLRLMVLKTQKSFMPPYLNISGRTVSNRVFMPGRITNGIPPGTLTPINPKETEGVTSAELAMLRQIQDVINQQSVSPTFAGQPAEGSPTATEINQTQAQAKMIMGLTIFAASMLEWKANWLRLKNTLAKWFQPEDTAFNDAKKELQGRYRTTNTSRPISGKGMGRRLVIPTKKLPSPKAVQLAQDSLSKESGVPTELIFLNPEEVQSAKLVWQQIIVPREKRTSEMQKVLFRVFTNDIQLFGPDVNMQELEEEFALIWGKNPAKLFKQGQQQGGLPVPPAPGQPGGMGAPVAPGIGLPNPQATVTNTLKNAIRQ